MHEFKSTINDFHSPLWRFHTPVPEAIASVYIEGDNRRVRCQLNSIGPLPLALMKCAEYWFVLINQNVLKKLKLVEGDSVMIRLEKDRSDFGHDMPEELQVLLDQDQEASKYFYALTKGKQRNLIYIVGKVKNPDSRLKKALAIASHLKEAKGQLDFKKLNEKIKYYNNL